MKIVRLFSLILASLWLLEASVAAVAEENKPMKKILILTFSGGFKHSCLELTEDTMAKIAKESGVFEAECLHLWQLDSNRVNISYLIPEYLNRYDALFLYTTTGGKVSFTEEQKQGLLNYVRNGKGLIGVHAASDSFYDWPEFGNMLGAYFVSHPWGANSDPVTIKVEDKNHPSTQMLGDSWTIQDEIYQFKEPYSRKNLHILLSLDTTKTDMDKDNLLHGKDGDYAVAWCRNEGKGRVFYTSLGHREDVWTNPTYQAHLLGGIKWALGLEPGDATPSEK